MRAWILLALMVLAPVASGLVPVDDPLAGAEQASDVVPRIDDAQTQDGSGSPLAPPSSLPVPEPTKPGAPVPPPAPAQQPSPAGPHKLPDTPLGRLVASLPETLSPETYMELVARYYRESGYAVPALQDVPPHQPNDFDENHTIQFPHILGDINQDGTEDVLMDIWCTSYAPYCPSMIEPQQDPTRAATLTSVTYCGNPHLVEARDGRTGKPLWNKSMDMPHPDVDPPLFSTACLMQIIMGTVPLEEGLRGILSYRIEIVGWSQQRLDIRHTIMLLDPHSGETLWDHVETGHYYVPSFGPNFVGQGVTQARNFVVNPLLDVPPAGQPYLAPNGSQMALSLQGVGFDFVHSNTFYPAPGYIAPFQLVEDYQPVEWLARLDPQTGQESWRLDTFQPRQDRSVLPTAYWQTPMAGPYPDTLITSAWDGFVGTFSNDHFWGYTPCCHDLDGDGRPEVIYTTLEWARFPSSNVEGPYDYDLRVVVFAGDGSGILYEFDIATQQFDETDAALFSLTATIQPVGDADGDGLADYLLRFRYHNVDTHSVFSLRKGATGEEMWRIDNIREMDVTVIGDVDGDGGGDLLLLEWFEWEYSQFHGWGLSNVTHVPVKVFQGATGELLWRDETFTAANDIASLMQQARLSGLPDLDGDGVMEVPLDNPIYLPDGTVIHQLRMVSPVDDRTKMKAITVGAFAYPITGPDLDGDGLQDLLLVNGDVLDLWLTAYGSKDGQALWSRRMADLRISSYYQVIPYMQMHSLQSPEGPLILLNFQMTRVYGATYTYSSSMVQRITSVDGDGGLSWSKPASWDPEQTAALAGATPASKLFEDLMAEPTLAELSSAWRPRLAPGGLGFLLAGLLGYVGMRRWGS